MTDDPSESSSSTADDTANEMMYLSLAGVNPEQFNSLELASLVAAVHDILHEDHHIEPDYVEALVAGDGSPNLQVVGQLTPHDSGSGSEASTGGEKIEG